MLTNTSFEFGILSEVFMLTVNEILLLLLFFFEMMGYIFTVN